jgi:hypothetical protein
LAPGCDIRQLTNKLGVLSRVRLVARSAYYINVRPSVHTHHRLSYRTNFREI